MKKQLKCKVSVRQILGLLALVIFVVQMTFAFQRFASDPTVYATGTKHILDIHKLPVITICPPPVFDYESASNMGYTGKTAFFNGTVQGKDVISWTGDSQKSFEDVKQQLWAEMIRMLDQTWVYGKQKNVLKPLPKNVITMPQGVCKSLSSYEIDSKRGPLNINIREGQITVYITNPHPELHFKRDINSMSGDKIYIDVNRTKSVHRHQYYKVELHETYLREGLDGCMNYSKTTPFSSYQDCVERDLTSKWLQAYGCVAPWMSDKNGCNTTFDRKPEHAALLDEVSNLYEDALFGYDPVFSNCLPPCIKTSVKVKYYGSYERPFWNHSSITISFRDTVHLSIMKSAYTEVDLLIEAGSSLGLWLGLSVIGLYDLFIILVFKLKTKLFAP